MRRCCFGGLQILRHSVKGVAQVFNFAGAGSGDPLGQITLAQPAGGGAQSLHRGQEPAGNQRHQQDAAGRRGQPGPPQGTLDPGSQPGHRRFPDLLRPGRLARRCIVGETLDSAAAVLSRVQHQKANRTFINDYRHGTLSYTLPFPALAALVVRVADHPAVGVGNYETPPVKGTGLFQRWLQSGPLPVFGEVPGNHPVHPANPKLLAPALEAVRLVFGGKPHVGANGGQGQGQSHRKGQDQPELEAEEPARRCQTCTPHHK